MRIFSPRHILLTLIFSLNGVASDIILYFVFFSVPWKRPETFGLRNLLFVIRYSDICSWTTLLLRHMVFDISSLFYLPLRLLLFWFLKMPKTTLLLRHLLFKTFAIQAGFSFVSLWPNSNQFFI